MEQQLGEKGGGRFSSRPRPFLRQASGHIFKDDVNGFSSTSAICFMLLKKQMIGVGKRKGNIGHGGLAYIAAKMKNGKQRTNLEEERK